MTVLVHIRQALLQFLGFLAGEYFLAVRLESPIRPVIPAVQGAVKVDLVPGDKREPRVDQVHRLLHPHHLVPHNERG